MRHSVVIVGAGVSGICAAIELARHGVKDVVLLEKAAVAGGTWRDNAYPGCLADVPAHAYSYSFALAEPWAHRYGRQTEILEYLNRVVDEHQLRPRIRFDTEATSVQFDAHIGHWRVETRDADTYHAPTVVMAVGPLHAPKHPHIPGIENFEGTAFHSAEWNPRYDPTGRRVAVIGTGASAAQIVPSIAPEAKELYVFQRTPPWVAPRHDRVYNALDRLAFSLPSVTRLHRFYLYLKAELIYQLFRYHKQLMRIAEWRARRHLRGQVPDPVLRSALTPNYAMGCKPIILSSTYYPALMRSNVTLVTAPIKHVSSRGIMTVDGDFHPVDDIIFATGFNALASVRSIEAVGVDGARLSEAWASGPVAYMGVAVAGFPNLFLMLGPNSGAAHNSMIFVIQAQARLIARTIKRCLADPGSAVGIVQTTQDAYNSRLQAALQASVWSAGACSSWYLDATGANRALWPKSTTAYVLRARATKVPTIEIPRRSAWSYELTASVRGTVDGQGEATAARGAWSNGTSGGAI